MVAPGPPPNMNILRNEGQKGSGCERASWPLSFDIVYMIWEESCLRWAGGEPNRRLRRSRGYPTFPKN
jgi:hypothetical protein